MPLIFNNQVFNHYSFSTEAEFEQLVERLADNIFGSDSIYISIKKRIKGGNIISVPDGYLIDMTDPSRPLLYIIENEIVSHDPFNHVGIQLLRFATSYEGARLELRKFLMASIIADKEKLRRLEAACAQSSCRNIDSYLDGAVYGGFKAIVIIDEAREELHNVIGKIRTPISVLEVKAFVNALNEFVYQYDTTYDEDETNALITAPKTLSRSPDDNRKRRERRAQCDTIVVPAQEEGFKAEFLGNNQWYAIRIGAAMKDRIRYIAAYQVAPVSALTHIAEVDVIEPYQSTGKYLVKFKGPAKELAQPLSLLNPDKGPQGPVYIQQADLDKAKHFDELIAY